MRTTEAGVRDDEAAWSASVAGRQRKDDGMRIGLVTPYSWSVPSGVNEHVAHLAAELEARGHQAWIIAPMGGAATPWRPACGRRLAAARELSWTRVTDQIVHAYEEAFDNHDVRRSRSTAPLRRTRRTRTPEWPGDRRRPRARATTRAAGERDGRTDRVLVP